MSGFPHCKMPCAECPWQKDAPLGHFPPERYVALARTAYDMSAIVFSCHMSKDTQPVACAGFLINGAAHNFTVRMAIRKDFDWNAIRSERPLFANYREMAIANGVDPDDPALAECRDNR